MTAKNNRPIPKEFFEPKKDKALAFEEKKTVFAAEKTKDTATQKNAARAGGINPALAAAIFAAFSSNENGFKL